MNLTIGLKNNGRPFDLPVDAVAQTFAILAIRGAGKTCTAAVMAEEMSKANLPWISFDPVGVWWGLRADANGKPGGFPVVVIGGDHADIPLDRKAGARLAESLISEEVSAVVDLSNESKRFWHTFLTDFCLELMQMNPVSSRHLFIEEAPEFVPQRTRVDLTARCKEAIERLVRLGRNRGYGCTLISQRPATIDKDVLSQCENLFVLRTTGPHDRKALSEWIEANASDQKLESFLGGLSNLENGTSWFWSPYWMKTFEKIRIRERITYHPGATRRVGVSPRAVSLSDVKGFVDRLRVKLSKTVVAVANPKQRVEVLRNNEDLTGSFEREPISPSMVDVLRTENQELRSKLSDMERRLVAVKGVLEPQYQAMRGLFEELGSSVGGTVDRGAYQPWLAKAGRAGTKRLLEIMIERQELTRTQLATLAGLSPKSGTYSNYLSWMRKNGLVATEGSTVRLIQL